MHKNVRVYSNLMTVICAFIVIALPLFRSGKTSLSVMVLELSGILILSLMVFTGIYKNKIDRSILWFVISGFLLLLVYLLPLPESVWLSLPGRESIVDIGQWIENNSDLYIHKSLSLVPYNTLSVLLFCLPALAVFLLILSIDEKRYKILIYTLIFSASLQACLGLVQFFTKDPFWYFGVASGGIQGTYLNTNHFTALMEMVEPMALGMMIVALIQVTQKRWQKYTKATVFFLLTILLTFAAYSTSSRMGAILLIVSIVLSFWAMTTVSLRKKVAGPIIVSRLVLLGLVVIGHIQLVKNATKVVAELKPQVVMGDLRWELFNASLEGIKQFFPFGSGPGTMPETITLFLSESNSRFQNYYINHVHNDYLEWLLETGVFGVIFLLFFALLYLRRWLSLYKNKAFSEEEVVLKAGAAIGILIFLIFGLTDFNLHTPANAIVFVFLLGVFFRKGNRIRDYGVNNEF